MTGRSFDPFKINAIVSEESLFAIKEEPRALYYRNTAYIYWSDKTAHSVTLVI